MQLKGINLRYRCLRRFILDAGVGKLIGRGVFLWAAYGLCAA